MQNNKAETLSQNHLHALTKYLRKRSFMPKFRKLFGQS